VVSIGRDNREHRFQIAKGPEKSSANKTKRLINGITGQVAHSTHWSKLADGWGARKAECSSG
jgi:hypothetical protein